MYIIGITGLSCSGKTSMSERLRNHLGDKNCLMISMDDYYKELTSEQYEILHNDSADINFDTPESIDLEQLKSNLYDLKNNKTFLMPKFDLSSCKITSRQQIIPSSYKYAIVEGLFIFSDPQVAELCNLKIWIETSDYICALRRFMKFTCQIKGYSHDYVYNQCIKYVIPGQEKFIKPLKNHCDLFINGENNNFNTYIEMIVKLI
jgi:uridine kinase